LILFRDSYSPIRIPFNFERFKAALAEGENKKIKLYEPTLTSSEVMGWTLITFLNSISKICHIITGLLCA
jgi:hypothetical protein